MSKFKLLIVLMIIVGGVAGGISLIDRDLSALQGVDTDLQQSITADGITWYQNTDKSFSIATFQHPLYIAYSAENAQSLQEQAALNKLILAVNGGFYRGSYVESEYAGLLQLDGESMSPLVEFEKQLTHVMVYDIVDDILKFEPAEGFEIKNYDSQEYTLMQTGPLVIKDNQVQDQLISESLNGTGRYLRTLIGYTNDGIKFLVITRVNFDLQKLAVALLEFEPFQGKQINVLNLDGGTSTAMYSRDFEQYNFGVSKRLPSIIGVQDPSLITTKPEKEVKEE